MKLGMNDQQLRPFKRSIVIFVIHENVKPDQNEY